MARAFIASVPPAMLLVGALVVPLAVIPGTFGFESWPSSRGVRVTERQVRLPAPKIEVVAVRPPRTVPERRLVLVAERPRAASPAPTTVSVAVTPRRAPVVRVPAPAPKPDPHPASARQQPTHQPSTPQPRQPAKNDSGVLAGQGAPVAREVAPPDTTPARPDPTPAPAPPPVSVPSPVERTVPSEPCDGPGNGHGHAYGRQDRQQGDDGSDG
jgi:hypothetical protein